MNLVDKVVNGKYYGKSDTEKFDLGRLFYLHTIAFFIIFFYLSFFLLEVSEVSNYRTRSLSKLMPVNLSQYRGVAGVFNS